MFVIRCVYYDIGPLQQWFEDSFMIRRLFISIHYSFAPTRKRYVPFGKLCNYLYLSLRLCALVLQVLLGAMSSLALNLNIVIIYSYCECNSHYCFSLIMFLHINLVFMYLFCYVLSCFIIIMVSYL